MIVLRANLLPVAAVYDRRPPTPALVEPGAGIS